MWINRSIRQMWASSTGNTHPGSDIIEVEDDLPKLKQSRHRQHQVDVKSWQVIWCTESMDNISYPDKHVIMDSAGYCHLIPITSVVSIVLTLVWLMLISRCLFYMVRI